MEEKRGTLSRNHSIEGYPTTKVYSCLFSSLINPPLEEKEKGTTHPRNTVVMPHLQSSILPGKIVYSYQTHPFGKREKIKGKW